MQASNDDFNNYRTAEHSVRMCGYLGTRKDICVSTLSLEFLLNTYTNEHTRPGTPNLVNVLPFLTVSRLLTPGPVLNTRVMVRCESWEEL